MAIKTKTNLKEYFQKGDKPTQGQFIDLIDSFHHVNESITNLNTNNITASLGVITSNLDVTTNITTPNITVTETGSFGRIEVLHISASTGDFDANTIKIGGSSFSKTDVDELKDVELNRKSSNGIPIKRIRGFTSASTFIDLEGTNQRAGDRIDIKVANTFEALSISTARVSLGPKETVPLELTGSLKVTPSFSDPHDLKGKYVFSGNPNNFGSAGTGIEISGSLDLSGSFANYSFENMSMDISQGGQLIYGALGVAMTGNSNVTIEEAVITQPGHISQSFNVGTVGDPSTLNMIGIGTNCYIKITEGVIIHVNEGSTFKIQCPQPDVTVNTDTDIITLSNGAGDETVISTGEFGTNPQYIASNYNVPAGNVAVWYGPIYIGRASVPNSVGYLVTNLGSLRLNNNSQIRIQAF